MTQAYSSVILTDAPIRYYRLDETTGTAIHDLGSQAQNGTLNGGFTLSQPSVINFSSDTSILLNGTTGYITYPTTSLPTGSSPFSLELWWKVPAGGPNAWNELFHIGNFGGVANAGLRVAYQTGATNNFRVDNVGFSATVVGGGPVTNGATYHVVMTYDGTNIALYVNGSLIGSGALALALAYGVAQTGQDEFANFTSGTLDEIAIYNYVLSADYVTRHYTYGWRFVMDANAAPLPTQGLLIPAYIYPTLAGWTQYVQGAPSTQIMVANVNSGPDTAVNSDYATGIALARSSHIQVVGYVHTSYGARALADVEADIDKWYSFYTIDGIFIDEVQGDVAHLSYYRSLFNYTKAKNPQRSTVVINPGVVPIEDYAYVSDSIVLFENTYTGFQTNWVTVTSTTWLKNYKPNHFCAIVHGIPDATSETEVVTAIKASGIGYMFITDQSGYTSAPSSTFWYEEQVQAGETQEMTSIPRRQQILVNTNLTASGNSGDLPSLSRDMNPVVVYNVEVTGSVSGTSPTLDIYIEAKEPSGNYATLQHLTQITATTGTTPVRGSISNVLEDTIRVRWVVGGSASPTFNGCYIDLYFASPDA